MSQSSPLNKSLDDGPDDALKETISIFVWGATRDEKERQDRLRSFFKHYNEQIQSRSTRYVQTHAQLTHVMRFLCNNPSVPRKDISSKLAPVLANLDPDETIDADAALDLAVFASLLWSVAEKSKRTSYRDTSTGPSGTGSNHWKRS